MGSNVGIRTGPMWRHRHVRIEVYVRVETKKVSQNLVLVARTIPPETQCCLVGTHHRLAATTKKLLIECKVESTKHLRSIVEQHTGALWRKTVLYMSIRQV